MLSVVGSDASLRRQTIGSGAVVLAVVLTMLIGTVGHASAEDGRRIAWSLTSWDAVIAMIPVDHGVLEDVVPEGFTAPGPPCGGRSPAKSAGAVSTVLYSWPLDGSVSVPPVSPPWAA